MSIEAKQLVRIAKRLVAATGYLELGMIQHALDQLDSLTSRGFFEAEIKILRGEALRQQNRYASAATALKLSAREASSPHSKAAWLALSVHCPSNGSRQRAARSLARARGDQK
jgi:predicted negative regulator of RcsB-dependent stress response